MIRGLEIELKLDSPKKTKNPVDDPDLEGHEQRKANPEAEPIAENVQGLLHWEQFSKPRAMRNSGSRCRCLSLRVVG